MDTTERTPAPPIDLPESPPGATLLGGIADAVPHLVWVATPDGIGRVVSKLGAGQVFGEMGLLTGAPRNATVTALSDTVCYRVDKEVFRDVLERRPEIAEAISHLLARRKVELDALTQGLDAEAARQRTPAVQRDLLQSIRRFFMLD